jgi:hypothetical protein
MSRALSTRAALLSINFGVDVSDPLLNYPNRGPIEHVDLLRAWTRSDGMVDRTPMHLVEVNLLKGTRGVALYQFTLERERYFAEITEEDASNGSCSFPEPAHYGRTRASYLGVFINNKLREVSSFDAWLRER